MQVTETPPTTRISVIDGLVRLSNALGGITLTNGQAGAAEPTAPPRLSASLPANTTLQWIFYYPGVVDLEELQPYLAPDSELQPSLEAYRQGDLLAALRLFPVRSRSRSTAESVLRAALELSVGRVESVERWLATVPESSLEPRLWEMGQALRLTIAGVKREPAPELLSSLTNSTTASAALALSYYQQAITSGRDSLRRAHAAADRATRLSPRFGFAWARLAELELSLGRLPQAEEAIARALKESPRHAEALAVRGFLKAARHQNRWALEDFETALILDPSLGNAWLGRGLCRLRLDRSASTSHVPSWLADLTAAAAAEPQRSLLRSYLGKGFATAGQPSRARHELELARFLDPADPTPWLYLALEAWEAHRPAEAIESLERSIALNDNRAVFRSRLLLDEDQAVRRAGLSRIYRDAGLGEVALREAARAMSEDYSGYAGHLFMAESLDDLRDPTRFNLRHETAWFNELLLANLLAPAGAGAFSPNLGLQEYGRLFERYGFGLTSSTEYRSDGRWQERAIHSGALPGLAYALDVDYQHNRDSRVNSDLDRLEAYGTVKLQISPQDSLLMLVKLQDYHAGDHFQHTDPGLARPGFAYRENQLPIAVAGYHREWSPGHHSLLLAGRLETRQRVSDDRAGSLVVFTNSLSPPIGAISDIDDTLALDLHYRSTAEIFLAEAQHILETEYQRTVVGARWHRGEILTEEQLAVSAQSPSWLGLLDPTTGSSEAGLRRAAGYAYWTWKATDTLHLTPGMSYEVLQFPRNFRHPPINPGEETRSQFAPKASGWWSPAENVTVRGGYFRSQGGVSLEESYRLEPAHLSGFPQSSRAWVSESLVGSVTSPRQDIRALALDLKLPTRTYLGLELNEIRSRVERELGIFQTGDLVDLGRGSLRQGLSYRERSVGLSGHQLLGKDWTAAMFYQFTQSRLLSQLNGLPTPLYPAAMSRSDADLHRLTFRLNYQSSGGFFARAEALSYFQNPNSPPRGLPDTLSQPESLYQVNGFVGWRFTRQRGDITFGGLNLTGQDYRLTPLTPHAELPRERVFYARFRYRF